ncbi:MAG: addiction module protein [Desulfuromonadales bacterium]|nr:addiction module protein [Desulfuromonadales bacterium]
MTVIDIEKMTVAERLLAMENLWASLAEEYQQSEIPSWHGRILDQRLEKLRCGEANVLTLDELDGRRR